MNCENIRVLARVMLLDKNLCGNLLITFSAVFRFAVMLLLCLFVFGFSGYMQSAAGRVVLIVTAFSLAAALVLLECTRTVKDRWFSMIKQGMDTQLLNLFCRFALKDIALSIRLAMLSYLVSIARVAVFFSVPALILALSAYLAAGGVSSIMLYILLAGNAVLLVCALLFCCVSLNCVSLARSLSFDNTADFTGKLRMLENNAFRLFRFGIMLSLVNRGSRRLAKIIFAEYVCNELCE